jgi:hypothetical protein
MRVNGGGGQYLDVHDSASVTLAGGLVSDILAGGTTTVDVLRGEVRYLSTNASARATIVGGTLLTDLMLRARNSSTIVIAGDSFRVDGIAVPFGELTAQSGLLTGDLESGSYLAAQFHQGGATPDCDDCTGTIRLVPALTIDVKPLDPINWVNLRHSWPLVVAILGSSNYDVRDVRVESLTLGPQAAVPKRDLRNPSIYRRSLMDINRDGYTDLLAVFSSQDVGFVPGPNEVCLDGRIGDRVFSACDSVHGYSPLR